jgi:nitrate reductase molybdenum cofactor assembly chaperone
MAADPVLASFADALDYPGADLAARLAACRDAVSGESGEAAALVAAFMESVGGTPAGRLEELYAAAFDLQEECAPYLGAHLFRGDHRRGAFMAHLAAAYRVHGLTTGKELPDHLGAVLRYLAAAPEDEAASELLGLAVVPAVGAIAQGLARQGHPWEPLLRGLLLVVSARAGAGAEAAPAAPAPHPAPVAGGCR